MTPLPPLSFAQRVAFVRGLDELIRYLTPQGTATQTNQQ